MEGLSRRTFLAYSAAASAAVSGPAFAVRLAAQTNGAPPILVSDRNSDLGNRALSAGWEMFERGGTALDAVEREANVIEEDPDDHSVGYGGLPNEEGIVELDASVMWGRDRNNAGAVGALRNIMHPSSVARRVMERSDHIYMMGEGALRFARAHGFREENLLTDEARKIWLEWKETHSENDDWIPEPSSKIGMPRPTGTHNILGIDRNGDIAGITTTSGLAFKIPGRVGDSPIIGAGLYLDNKVGAAGATGRGEEVIKVCGSFLIVEKMRDGLSPQEACEFACRRIIDNYDGNVFFNDKFVAVNKSGEIGCAQIRGERPPEMGVMTERGIRPYIGKSIIGQ